MVDFRDQSSMDNNERFPNASTVALSNGISLLYAMVNAITSGDVALTAKVHDGLVMLVECRTTNRILPLWDSSDGTPEVSNGVTLEQTVSWFYEMVGNKEYGEVELVCTVRDARVVRVNQKVSEQRLVVTDDGVANAA